MGMSLLFHLSFVTFYCLVCHVASMVLLNFLFPWLEAKEIQNVSSTESKFAVGFFVFAVDSTNESSLTYKRFIVVNFIVVCTAGWIYSLCPIEDMERRVVNFLQPYVHTKGKHITWMKKSVKHRRILKKLVRMLKDKSYAVNRIGEYQVCFEEQFCIGHESNDTEVFVGLGTDGVEVSVKRLNVKSSPYFQYFAENEKEMMNSPRLVDSPHVLNYRFYFESKQYAYLVTDLQEENLNELVLSNEHTLAELQNQGPTILRQTLLGLRALHDDNILHRDLKPENVLVNCEGKMVLANFGISRRLEPGQSTHASVQRGRGGWVAVESLPNDDDDVNLLRDSSTIIVRYNKKSDIQVLGMIFYFVLTKGNHPFGKWYFDRLSNIRKNVFDISMTDNIPVAKDLIQWMLQHNRTKRPTVKQCLKHPYLISPEENFKFLTTVGNEKEIKMNDYKSSVVQTLEHEASLTTPPWCEEIDEEVYGWFSKYRVYSNNGAELLRFIRNAAVHWPAPFLQKFGTPQAYFLKVFPTLPMIVHKILRELPDWYERDTLKQFF